jgi:predicted esterase YcpF (UPF0227 family)
MLDHYPGVRTTLIQGGDHAISDFPNYLADVIAFCDQAPPAVRATAAA